MAKFKYRGEGRSVESASRRAKQSGGGYDSYLLPDIPFFKPKEGENAVRIMPPTWEDQEKWGDNWEIQVHLHRNVGPDDATYLCLDKMLGKPCPPCEARRHAADEDEADALRIQWRALCWVIDRNDEKAGPQVWGLPVTLFREINLRSIDRKTNQLVLIDHPEEGYDLLFSKEGTGKKTKYTSIEIDRDPTPLHDNEKRQDTWLDYIQDNPLPNVLNFYDAEHIEKVLFGSARAERTEEPRVRGTSRRGNGAAAPEEEDAGRGSRRSARREPEPAEDEQEDRPPTRRGRSEPEEETARPTGRRGRTDPEPEEADAEAADGEEEAPPPRRGRTTPPAEDEPAPTARRPRAAPVEDEAEDPPPPRRGGAAGKSGGDEEPEGQARRQLSRLRGRASK